jgi:hypothetical protein
MEIAEVTSHVSAISFVLMLYILYRSLTSCLQANYSASALIQEAYKITPILTVFIGGDESAIERTSPQITCLKVVTEEDPSDDDDSSESSAVALRGGWLTVTIAVLVGIVIEL